MKADQLVRGYYAKRGIKVHGPLEQQLRLKNNRALRYVAYAIGSLKNVPGVQQKLKSIASIKQGGNQAKRVFLNALVEFHAFYFVQRALGLRVLQAESPSPARRGSQLCDVRASDGTTEAFFEVKTSSFEVLSEYRNPASTGLTHFQPDAEAHVAKWIRQKSRAADRKGRKLPGLPNLRIRGPGGVVP